MTGEEMKEILLSNDDFEVWKCAFEVLRLATMNPSARWEILQPLRDSLPQIKENIPKRDFNTGEAMKRACKFIEEANDHECMCQHAFSIQAHAMLLSKSYGFQLLDGEHVNRDERIISNIIRCPNCGNYYLVKTQNTGYHYDPSTHTNITEEEAKRLLEEWGKEKA